MLSYSVNSPKAQVEFVTRLAYNLDGLPGRLKLYFSQFISFHFSNTLTPEQIHYIENKLASHPFGSNEEMADAVRDFTTEERVWVVAAMMILKSEAEAIDDRVFSHKLDTVIKDITEIFGLSEEGQKILAEKNRLEEEARRFQNRKLIRVRMSVRLLALDFALRWFVLFFLGKSPEGNALLIVSNVFFIPLVILALAYITGRRNRKRNFRLLETYGGEEQFRIEFWISTSQYTWLAFFLATGVFIGYLLPDQQEVVGFLGLTVYYFALIRFFLVGRIDENELVKQLEADDQNLHALNRDENDEVIVALETKLNSLTGRLEAYVLESALFGALTFSGFLQIISSELVTFESLEHFATAIFDVSRALIRFDDPGFWSAASNLDNKVSLFCLVSVESLVCSVFFLAVIASRLRFSNVADQVRSAINLAKVYNAKEEAFYQEEDFSEKRNARLAALNSKVNEQLQATVEAMREVEPVMTYMQYFRNAGILVFLIILLSSTLFITTVVGWAFLALVAATFLYFNRQVISLSLGVMYLNLRIQFSRRSTWFGVASFFPFVIGLILRDVLFWNGAGAFVALGYLSVGAYLFLWLWLSAHVDNEFGEIETDAKRIGQWKFVKSALGGLIFFYCIGMAMKYQRLAGANELIMISLNVLTLLLYFVGYYLSKIRWLGIVAGGLLATFSIGILFKTLHLVGANEMLLIGVTTLGLMIPVIFWLRKKFHVLFLKVYIFAFVLAILYISNLLSNLDLAISHRTWSIGRISDVVNFKNGKDVKASLERTDWYIDEYGTRAGYSNVYEPLARQYYYYCEEIVLGDSALSKDSIALTNALLLARQSNRIDGMFGYDPEIVVMVYLGLEADILAAMNRQEEAIESLKRILASHPPKAVVEFLEEKIKGIESGRNVSP